MKTVKFTNFERPIIDFWENLFIFKMKDELYYLEYDIYNSFCAGQEAYLEDNFIRGYYKVVQKIKKGKISYDRN